MVTHTEWALAISELQLTELWLHNASTEHTAPRLHINLLLSAAETGFVWTWPHRSHPHCLEQRQRLEPPGPSSSAHRCVVRAVS